MSICGRSNRTINLNNFSINSAIFFWSRDNFNFCLALTWPVCCVVCSQTKENRNSIFVWTKKLLFAHCWKIYWRRQRAESESVLRSKYCELSENASAFCTITSHPRGTTFNWKYQTKIAIKPNKKIFLCLHFSKSSLSFDGDATMVFVN